MALCKLLPSLLPPALYLHLAFCSRQGKAPIIFASKPAFRFLCVVLALHPPHSSSPVRPTHQVGNFLHFISTFIVGMIIGFVKVWQLALVILAVVPLIAVCGATYAVVLTGLTSKEQEAYQGAGEIAQQVRDGREAFELGGEGHRTWCNEHSSACQGLAARLTCKEDSA